MIGFSNPCHLDESTFIFRGIKKKINFISFFDEIPVSCLANSIAQDEMLRSASSLFILIDYVP